VCVDMGKMKGCEAYNALCKVSSACLHAMLSKMCMQYGPHMLALTCLLGCASFHHMVHPHFAYPPARQVEGTQVAGCKNPGVPSTLYT